ncbi:MAG: hypothetical protein OSA48_00135 [Akkermansiaceae bacterium]|nr:hypothetical protein [Akkermansiaceae bacterium]
MTGLMSPAMQGEPWPAQRDVLGDSELLAAIVEEGREGEIVDLF